MSRRESALIRELIVYFWSLMLSAWASLIGGIAALLRRPWVWGAMLVVITLIAYGPALRAGFVWDDDIYLTRNPLMTEPGGWWRLWFSTAPPEYVPLTLTSFYIEHALWGLNPAGYHLVNLLLHAANAVLVWQLLRRLGVPGAWLAGALFAVHPVQVESAAWIAERKNVLMGLFFLLALWEWIRFVDEKERPWRVYALSLVFFALALLSKTTACMLPAALLLVLWLKKAPIDGRRLAQVAPFVVMGLGMGLLSIGWAHHQQGPQDHAPSLGMVARVLLAGRALWFYLGKLFWPANLCFSYPHWTISASDPLLYLWLLATVALAVVIWRLRPRTGRGLEVALAFFVLTLSPLLGFIMVYTFSFSFVADHYQYLACIGPLALLAAGIHWGFERLKRRPVFLQPCFCIALLLTLGTLTWWQSEMYADAETLWRTTIVRNPDSWLAQLNLGKMLLDDGDLEVAITRFQKAAEIDPGSAKAHDNLGIALARNGQVDQAIAEYQKAIALEPNMAKPHEALGLAFLRKKEADEAIDQFQKALAIQPHLAGGENSLGIAYAEKGESMTALDHFQKAVEDNPNDPEARSNLAMALAQHGKPREAVVQYQKLLEVNPANMEACNNLAWLLATSSDPSLRNGPRAVALAQQALDLAGHDDPVVLHTLSSAYAETKNYADALSTAQRALTAATGENNGVLAGKLREEIKTYQKGGLSPAGLTPGQLRGWE